MTLRCYVWNIRGKTACEEGDGEIEMEETRNKLTLEATVENLERVTEFVDRQLEKMGCPAKIRMQMNIAVDELFGNIAHYAYPKGKGMAAVEIEPSMREGEAAAVVVTFTDWGVPYNPLLQEEPDVTLSAEERQIGGLGLHIVKKSMDDISYEYKEGRNILKIRKRI